MLPPILVELRASSTEFMAKMKEARLEVAHLETSSRASFTKMQTVGKYATLGVAAGVAAIGVESVKMAGDFQKETNVLVTAAGESADSLGVVRKGILDIASSTGSTWQNLTEGMYQVEKAGFRGADGLKVLRAASQGAAEENADLSTVTAAMTSVMASYHLGAESSVQVMNALKTAAGGTKDTMENFAGSLSTVLPIASAAGLDFAQVGGALATLTRHGTSSAEATQELANTIRNLQAPNKVALKQMEQWGISSTDLSTNLGKRGLGGTLEYLVDTIATKMGPNGVVLQDVFKRSKSAGQDMTLMMKNMSPEAQKLAKDMLSNTISIEDYRKKIKSLPNDQLAMARQFATLTVRASGFSDALKSGSPQATTMSAILKQMLGGSTGLNTALMLTGENQAYLNDVTKRTAESLHNNSKEVEGWDSTSKLMNVQLAKMHQQVERVGITIGTFLIPKITAVMGFFSRHTTVTKILATAIGTFLVAAITAYVVGLATAATKSVANYVRMTLAGETFFARQAIGWAGLLKNVVIVVSSLIMQGARWVAQSAVQMASFLATQAAAGAVWVAGVVARAAVATAAMLASFATQIVAAAAWAAAMLVAGATAMLPFLPIIAVVALVGIAAYELYKHWDVVWSGIKTVLGAAWAFIKRHFTLILTVCLGPFGLALGLLISHWRAVWSGIQSTLSTAWGILKTVFGLIVKSGIWLVRNEIRALQNVWSGAWSLIRRVVSDAWSIIKPIFDKLMAGARAVKSAIGGVASVAGKIGGAVGGLGGFIPGFADGGYVPGPAGAARLAVVHGGEYVASRAELAGRPRSDSPFGGGSGGVVEVHSHTYLDGREVHRSVQTQELRYQGRNGRSAFA